MKYFIGLALFIACALAVNWESYNCAAIGALAPNAYTCAEWNTIPCIYLIDISCLH